MTLVAERNIGQESSLTELVLAAQEGDRESFGLLVERFDSMVFGTALRRLGNRVDAQELTQEVFVQALRKIYQLRRPEAFAGWLRSITVRMAINRTARRRIAVPTEPETLAATCVEYQTPPLVAMGRERARQVHGGLRRLRELDRDTLVAFYLKGRSILEMSEDFQSPVGTIKRRLHVARKRLAKELEDIVAV